MPPLPLEIIRQIVEDIIDDFNDPVYHHHLSVISLSCRLLRYEAQRLLFRKSGRLYTSSLSRKRAILFLDTIISSPERLGLFVCFLCISFDDLFDPDSDETTALIQKLAAALGAMHNLTTLEVFQEHAHIRSLPNILQDTHFKLTFFTWSGYSDTQTVVEASVQADFLRNQDKIESLVMSGFIDENALKPIAAGILPHLQSLCAPYPFTEILLPGKERLTSLRWTAPRVDPATPLHQNLDPGLACQVEAIEKDLGRIRYLSYDSVNSAAPVGPSLERIVPHLTNLMCLDTRRGDIKKLEALSQLPRLQVLVLNVGSFDGGPVPKTDYMIEVAIACKCLEHVDIEDDLGGIWRFEYDDPSKSFEFYRIDEDEWYLWSNDFDIFDDD